MSVGSILLTYAICFVPLMVIFAIMPYIGRRTLTFGVSIPSNVFDDERLKKMRGSFAATVVILGVLLGAFSLLPYFLLDENTAVLLMTVLVFVYIVLIGVLYITRFRKVKAIKKEEGWAQTAPVITATDTKFSAHKRSVSALWFLLYVVIIAATLAAGLLLYEQIPEEVVMQSDFDGNPTRMVEKSMRLIMFAPAIQAAMALLMGFVYWMMQRTPPVIDPEQPQVSSIQNAKFRYRWSAFIVFMGIVLILIFAFMQLTFIVTVPQSLTMWVTLGSTAVIVITAIVLSITTGQSGSRIKIAKTKDGGTINRNDDKYWKGGAFYINKDDPALFVEKRFGVGFTINFGRPLAIILFVGILAVIIGVSVLVSVLAG